jgi:hypothetical protein
VRRICRACGFARRCYQHIPRLFDAKPTLFSKTNYHVLAALFATEKPGVLWHLIVLAFGHAWEYDTMILLRRHLNDMNEIVLRANIIFLRILSSPFSTMASMATPWSDVSALTRVREAFS